MERHGHDHAPVDTTKREVHDPQCGCGESTSFAGRPEGAHVARQDRDKIKVDYSVGVALSLKKGGGRMDARKDESHAASRSPSGATLGGEGHQATRPDVREDCSPWQASRSIRLKGPEGA
jgi:hypothetical protein